MDDHPPHTRDVTMVLRSTLLYIRTMESNNALVLPYPRRTDVCDSVSVVKSFKKAGRI